MNQDPDLKLAGLSMWVLGRQFPDQADYWDGNWLEVRVRVEASGAIVKFEGHFVRVTELVSFADELEILDTTLAGEASLDCMEPYLDVRIRGERNGQATATVEVTPDNLTQFHKFIFSIDQTYYKLLIAYCRKILLDYPVRGELGEQ